MLSKSIDSYDKSLCILNHPIAFSLFQTGNYVLHASAIEINNYAYLFIGSPGSGKSYIVNKLLDLGKFITEDLSRIKFSNGKSFIYSSIPIIKLTSEQIEEERFSKIFMINNDARNRKGCILKDHSLNGLYEIKGCYFLERSKNETEIVSIKDKNLFSILLANSICGIPRNKCLESEESLLNNIGMFIDSTSFYNYKRPLDDNINFLLDHISSVGIK